VIPRNAGGAYVFRQALGHWSLGEKRIKEGVLYVASFYLQSGVPHWLMELMFPFWTINPIAAFMASVSTNKNLKNSQKEAYELIKKWREPQALNHIP